MVKKMTIAEHNINADHFFRWLEKHWKYYVGSRKGKQEALSMFEDEVCPNGSGWFVLSPGATVSGVEEIYDDFARVWYQLEEEDEYDYVFVHGRRD
ncbi:MAG: hypothetical protein M0P69_15270 [Bacteroidales bacterium]|jgi:hypothetical protein|nr:hypothetical protein [Bacteroidales bacterium]